jgi:formate hydrogenlyase subunit 3/multisubunit Na+/H+ antiporter MnhD subunit
VCMVMAVMASSGLPGFANFVSEVMVFIGAWKQGSLVFRVATICAVWGIVVTATYLLWAVRTSFFGPFDEKWSMLKDATSFKQKFPYALLLAVLLAVGFWPRLLTDIIQRSVQATILRGEGRRSPVVVGDVRSAVVRGQAVNPVGATSPHEETHAQQEPAPAPPIIAPDQNASAPAATNRRVPFAAGDR